MPGATGSTRPVAPGMLSAPVPPNHVSARFFLELALGLWIALACIDRRAIGAGFTRLMALFALASLVPAGLLLRGAADGSALTSGGIVAFAALVAAALALAGRVSIPLERTLVAAGA